MKKEKETKAEPVAKEKKKPSSGDVVFAIILIFIGSLFLANNLGILSWAVWADLLRFWPVLLVLWGLSLMLGRSKIAQVIMGIITGAVLLFVLLYILAGAGTLRGTGLENWGPFRTAPSQTEKLVTREFHVAQNEFQNVEERTFNIESGIGKFILEDNNFDDYFLLRATSHDTETNHFLRTEQNDGTLNVNVNVPGDKPGPGILRLGERFEYDGTIGQTTIPTSINLSVGAGEADVTLDEVSLRDLSIEVGVGSAKVSLDDNAVPQNMNLDVGVGSIELAVPEDIGVEVNYSVGLGSFEIDNENFRDDGSYRTSNFDQAERKVHVTADVGTGSISIEN